MKRALAISAVIVGGAAWFVACIAGSVAFIGWVIVQ